MPQAVLDGEKERALLPEYKSSLAALGGAALGATNDVAPEGQHPYFQTPRLRWGKRGAKS
ncbi:MAG: hypothetical protein WBD87_08815 [Candidatus Acidiferrales bacterium]